RQGAVHPWRRSGLPWRAARPGRPGPGVHRAARSRGGNRPAAWPGGSDRPAQPAGVVAWPEGDAIRRPDPGLRRVPRQRRGDRRGVQCAAGVLPPGPARPYPSLRLPGAQLVRAQLPLWRLQDLGIVGDHDRRAGQPAVRRRYQPAPAPRTLHPELSGAHPATPANLEEPTMKYRLGDLRVETHPTSWAAPTATLIGKVRLQAHASVWFGAVLRGDNELIDIGE